ncbi:hypothetical protein P170DRAFT_470182 [Aspergillus steynii IBT 23096]|uniref:Uncharacterized protein n=1 Tax=Aspergillus steynii IBT 23096 TaxID=1392250 RepID=A0A2I2GPD5_9EURO|nr:uncharacterized protein P170DRAFT_470182 [Aspergillus steynii IBT 23096]PLB54737.1 hypothetical protein P170DRAFT_470182 [Aspergillus steynii IBT 23096]
MNIGELFLAGALKCPMYRLRIVMNFPGLLMFAKTRGMHGLSHFDQKGEKMRDYYKDPWHGRYYAEHEARTDGYLRGKAQKEVRTFIKVKTSLRENGEAEVRVQESEQMVAWLKASPNAPRMLPSRRFHVSQDRHEI